MGPATSAGEGVEYLDVGNDSFQTGGFGLIQNKSFDRKHYSSALTRILAGHEIKGGLEYEQETAKVTKRMSGGQQVSIFANPVDPKKPIYLHFYWTTPDATVANAPLSAIRPSAVARRLTQISIAGGSAETEQTAVAVRPLRTFPDRAVTMATDDTTCRITVLNSSSVTDSLTRMSIASADASPPRGSASTACN